ncbi:unnamed protein product [Adineta ricciae]|uniref:Tetratricopeptide repeat protein n=1 Tax=Adineta ricciae TaxID=249248 RepID=A0A814I568_ADIRI|nr:unnamed protein product [Adineta ricciae]
MAHTIDTKRNSVENFILVWLDPNGTEHRQSSHLFQSYINTIKFYSSSKELLQFVEEIHDEEVFVIISEALVKDIVARLEPHKQIYSIYILCNDRHYQADWTKDFRKIQGVYADLRPIHDAIRRDVRQATNDLTSIAILSNNHSTTFFNSLLLSEILLHYLSDEQKKRSLIEFARDHYRDNPNELIIIDLFENNVSKQLSPIEWYTRECFLSSMIHRALRLADIDILYQTAFFISDLHKQISDLYAQSTDPQTLSVYYSQALPNDRFQYLNMQINDFISFNTFLRTTIDREISLSFARQSANNTNLTSIFFQIDIDRANSSFPFVSLDQLDYFHDTDRHILFSLNPIFQIKLIERFEDKLWRINLILVDDKHEQIKNIIDPIRHKHGRIQDFFTLGRYMIETTQFDKAKKIFESLLKNTHEKDSKQCADIHRYLAYAYEKCQDHSRALYHYKSHLDIELQLKPENQSLIASIHSHIGTIEKEQGNYDQARHAFISALKIVVQSEKPDSNMVSLLMYYIGQMYLLKQDYPNALETFQKALKPSPKSDSIRRTTRADIYRDLSIVFDSLGHNNEAIEHALEALTIAKQKYGENRERIKIYQDQYDQLTNKKQ